MSLCVCHHSQAVLSLLFVSLHRQHHHVRRPAALRVRVRPYCCHFLHLAHPDRAADGGTDHSDVALAHDGRRAAELGVLRRFSGLPARIYRYVNTHTPRTDG